MAYNKRQKIQENIEAIRIVFQLERDNRVATPEERELLRKYSGFGGLKFILNYPMPLDRWKASDRPFFEATQTLFDTIREFASSDSEFDQLVNSVKSSVNTAFYTPNEIITALSSALSQSGVIVNRFLDPSSGNGKFVDAFREDHPAMEAFAIEKDLLTGRILKALHPDDHVIVNGFETIPQEVLGTYDVVSSNIPFGDVKVFDPAYSGSKDMLKQAAANTLHNYFFLKALDAAREGGLVAFITSRGVMDSLANEPFRNRMMQNARLVSAIRLPDGLFSDIAGTEAGSDLIILQKVSRPQNRWTSAESLFRVTSNNSDVVNINLLFSGNALNSENPHILADEVVLGKNMYGEKAYEYRFSGAVGDLAYRLESVLEDDFRDNLDIGLYNMGLRQKEHPKKEEKIQQPKLEASSNAVQLDLFALWDAMDEERISMVPRPYKGGVRSNWHDGTIIVDSDQLGMLSQMRSEPLFTPMELNANQEAILRQYTKVRDSYDELYRTEAEEQRERPDLRELLNNDYDNFFVRFGHLNDRKNQRIIVLDAGGRDALSLEYSDGEKFVKADIFDHPVSFNTRQLDHVDNALDALFASLNRTGTVDLNFMSGLSDLSIEELKDELKDRIFFNPLAGGYEVADKFLAGNVVDKFDRLENWKTEDEIQQAELQRSLEALKNVIPTPVTFDELDFNFGERWMPAAYFAEFASGLFDTDIKIEYAPQLDEFIIDPQESTWDKVKINNEFAIATETGKAVDGLELLRHALYNTVPTIEHVVGYKPNGDPIKGPDHEKIQLAASKIDEIREAFTQWIAGHDKSWKEGLADMYNRKYNCFVRANYDGSHQTFPGLDLRSLNDRKNIPSIYDSQKDAVWMLLQNGGGVCDHEVGTGKTLIMCIAAHEMKRLGMANKPIIIGMKANVSEIAATYQTAYPNDRILYATPKDFSDRLSFFNRMKNNDYDCIIMSHDQFAMIPQSLEIQQKVMGEEIRALDEALEVYGRSHRIGSRMLTGLEKRKDNLVAKLQDLNWRLKQRADDVVDFKTMGIDHIFVDESQAFKNLAFTTRDNRVAGLGDPSGSQRARDLQYAIRTIQERTGRDLGATFLSGTTISNSLTELYLLFKYLRPVALSRQDINSFDAWAAVFAKKSRDYEINVAGQVVMKERFRNFIKVPELAAFYNEITDYKTAADVGLERPQMNVQLVNIKPTEDHLDFSKRLLEFAQSGDGQLIFREELSPSEKMAKMLIVTGLGKKASLSPKLVNPEYHEGDNTKIGEAAKKIGEYYHLFNEQKGTQFVFCDLSTPKKGEWNAYQELKVRLVSQYGIPDEEIQFIQDASTEKKRKEFIAKMNTGEIRVLFGSTTTLGTGVNAQERAVAIHHLDLPWRPSDMEQRNGRAVRKGNLVARQYNDNKVDVFVYAVERSLDPYNFYLLSSKQDFIRQMKTGALGKRSFDQGGEDEASGMPFAEYVAITSGNTDLLERAKLEKRILGLESERKAFNAQQRSVAFQLDYARKDLEHDRNILAVLRQDMEVFENAAVKDEQGKFVNTLDVGPGIVTDEDKGRYLQDNARCLITEEVQVGSIYGFPVVMRPQSPEERANKSFNYQGNIFSVKGAYSYRINAGRVNLASRVAAASFPFESITRLPSLVSEYENYVARLEKEIPDLERLSEKVWDKSEQLSEMKQQLQALDRKIQQTLDSSIIQNQGGKGVESLPFTIVQHNWGREPWELKFKVSDYPYLNNEDRDAVEDAFHGSLRVYHGEVRGNFRHRFGAESAMMELTKLNQSHRDDVSWLTAAVQDVYDESSSYAYSRLKEMGLDRYGKPLQEEAYHLDAIALGNYMDVRALAHGAKERIDIPFEVAAKALARVVKAMPEAKHGVLVPMPGHTRDRDAMVLLTRMVAEQTGLDCVQNYLISAPHQSLYDWKKQHPNEELPDLFFVEKNKEVLKGRTPIIIDNVLDTGHTAWAALEAMSVQPVLVVLGATGNHERYGRDISLTIDQNSLDYIHNITPPGVGFTGKEQFEIDELFRKTRSEAWSARHSATEDLQDMGLDRNTGLYTFEVYDALQRWDSIYASGQASDVVNKVLLSGGYDQLFSEEERQHLTDADRTRMESLLKEYKGYSSDHVLEREYLYRPLVVNYEHLRGKAQLSMENVIQDAEVIEEANVQQETPSLGYDYETKSFNGIPADLKVYCNGEPDRIREVYGYTPNDDIDLVHFSAQGGREYDRTFARVWVEDKQAESPAKIVIQLEKEGYDVGLHGERGRYVDFGTWDEAVAFEQHVREIEQQLHAPKDVQETQVSPAQQSYGPVESPLMKQFYDLKAKHPDALLLFRSGDFYEAYEKDAKTASDLLGLTLTWRKELDGSEQHDYNTYHGAQVMFPHHALDTYLPKLVRAGLRIAICDQLEAPKRTVKRGTTELVDSGSGIRMQVVARQSSLSESEKKMISTIVSDLETGNHLLGRPRPEGYRQFFAEHYEAVRALQAGNKLTERQRDILLERVGNYYDGLSGLAASLEVNEQQLRKALYVDSISEQRTHPNLHLFEDGLYWYVESRTGYGVSQRYAEQVASLHSGEKTDYDGRTMMRFISKDDAVSFIGSISTLNDHYAKTLRDGLIERMRRACISVITNWEEGERVLALENGKPRMMAVDRNSEEYKKKVSDATQRIEIRLAELNRSINEENNLQSASRIPAKEPTPPLESGNKEAISSLAKVQRKIIKSNDLLEKMFSFIDNFPLTSQINAENYARNLISALDLPLQN